MKLLLINPNTSEAVTDLIVREARKIAAPGTEIRGVTGRFGPRYVGTRASYAIAGHSALDAYAEHGADADAIVLACFGDPALLALKEIAHQPVIGLAEASCRVAVARGGKFGIVTGGERWSPMIREFVALIGMSERLAGITTVAPSGAEIAREPEKALDLLAEACRTCLDQHGADCVILGGAGLAGLAEKIAHRVPAVLVDSLAASVGTAEMIVRGGGAVELPTGSFEPGPGVETIGLGAALARLMSGS